ncbi:MAG: AraC family transcriptional regulator, partial [Tunicatimonas sp.]|uniref:helix-turn-helix domain-containing protein n=1 Tax=Tunicatimonas sp. TaxID=1940096 RepID=UPI003C755377
IQNYYDVENSIIILNRGEIHYGEDEDVVSDESILFIPGGKMMSITYGSGDPVSLSNDDFINNKELYFQSLETTDITKLEVENFSFINFEAKVFDSVNFFASLDIPPFEIKGNPRIVEIIKDITGENNSETPGKDRIIKISTERLVIEIVRHILETRMFVEQLATNSTYFKDPRLIDIFAYIKNNIGGDLSNKVLANVANVSEDYVGQYFKMLTGINPQDYIEYQRMEHAVNLLRTTKKSIREIGKEVGYKDTAYFCRRFKMMFGIPAGKMRRRESLMNV